jgi:hypothetical protein
MRKIKKGTKEEEEDNIQWEKKVRKKEKYEKTNKDGKLIALQYRQRIVFLQCVYPCRTGGVPGGTACCIETSQRLSRAPRVDNYTAQTFASWPRRGDERKWHRREQTGWSWSDFHKPWRIETGTEIAGLKTDRNEISEEWFERVKKGMRRVHWRKTKINYKPNV